MKEISINTCHRSLLAALICGTIVLTNCSLAQDKLAYPNRNNLPSSNSVPEIPRREASKTVSNSSQSIFHAEEGIEHSIEIPSDVLYGILKSGSSIPKDCIDNPISENPCFVASNALLNEDNYSDIIVMGQGQMLGANVTTFWAFEGSDTGYRLVLTAVGLQLIIGENKRNRFYQIDVARMTASEIFLQHYEYEKSEYQLKYEKKEKI